MEQVTVRLAAAERALASLKELLVALAGAVERDAAIQRFQYSVEATWKAVQVYLRVVEGVEVGSPKRAVRESLVCGLLSEDEARRALAMIDDRNLTSHTYHEALALAIAARLPDHATLLERWLANARRALDDATGRSPAPELS